MNKYTTTLRWFSLIPVAFTTLFLLDWAVRFLFWFMRLPIIVFEKIGFSSGSIGELLDNVTGYLVGLDSSETLIVIVTGLLTGYAAVYVLAIVAPTNNKKTAKVLAIIYSVLLALGLIALIIIGVTGENILWAILLTIGILLAWKFVNGETEQEAVKYENFVQKNIVPLFISTLLFTILLVSFFLIA